MPNTGTVIGYDFITSRTNETGPLFIRANVSTNVVLNVPPLGWREYDWSLEISLPSGGFVQASETLPFTAPESGYTNIAVLHQVGEPNWGKKFGGTFYVSFGEPWRYGLVKLDFTAITAPWRKSSDFGMSYWINTNGSRNLEKNPANRVPPPR